jgi:hypothetical protein
LPLHLRKNQLSRLLSRRVGGVQLAPFEQGEIGPDLFRKACEFGLEGMVSKRRDRPYRAGRSPDWVKVKNRSHPAMERVKEVFSSRIKDDFDLWWEWEEKPSESMLTISATIHDAVDALFAEDRRYREKINRRKGLPDWIDLL